MVVLVLVGVGLSARWAGGGVDCGGCEKRGRLTHAAAAVMVRYLDRNLFPGQDSSAMHLPATETSAGGHPLLCCCCGSVRPPWAIGSDQDHGGGSRKGRWMERSIGSQTVIIESSCPRFQASSSC